MAEGTDLSEYRKGLVSLEQKAQDKYDKHVLSLSGGALGISFAFVKNFIPGKVVCIPLLYWSWIFWGASSVSILFSFFFCDLSLRRTIKQIDENTFRKGILGGWYSIATAILNVLGGLFFLLGLIYIIIFIKKNFGNIKQ